LAGIVELLSIIFCTIGLRYVGRKKLTTIFMFLTGIQEFGFKFFVIQLKNIWNFFLNLRVVFLAIITLTIESSLRVILVIIGKFCKNTSFTILYVFAAEILVTALSSSGIGTISVAGRIESMSAPFVKELVSFLYSNILFKNFFFFLFKTRKQIYLKTSCFDFLFCDFNNWWVFDIL
jgi:hypothetical protein